MVFGRYRFSFEHPEDFAPATLSGARDKGFARLQADRDRQIYVRWFPTRKGVAANLPEAMRAELAILERQAKKRRESHSSEVIDTGGILRFTFAGSQHFSGFGLTEGKTVFVVAATGKSPTAARRLADGLIESFETNHDRDRWAMLGLDLTTPGRLRIADQKLLSGRTSLTLAGWRVRILVERWALAKQILDRHELDGWAKATLNMGSSDVREHPTGVELERRSIWGTRTTALVKLDVARNQIELIRSTFRRPQWKPEWDWFNN